MVSIFESYDKKIRMKQLYEQFVREIKKNPIDCIDVI